MFCDKCGAEIEASHRFCNHCGREFGATGAIGFSRRGRVSDHIRLVGILWLALSACNAVAAVILYILSNTLFVHLPEMSGQPSATAWLRPFIAAISVIIAAKALAGFFAGWGLLQREPWARLVTIVLAFLALFNIPFGTALGIYTLWVLLPEQSDLEYQEQVRSVSVA